MMEKTNKIYLCIDLKSFYASVECVERGLDPFEVNLVVADIGNAIDVGKNASGSNISACSISGDYHGVSGTLYRDLVFHFISVERIDHEQKKNQENTGLRQILQDFSV